MARLSAPRHTSRLVLRHFESGDLDGLASIYERDDVNRYLYSEPRSRDDVRALLERKTNQPIEIGEDNILFVAVVLRDTNRFVGDFMLKWRTDEHRQGEMGGSLHPEVHGQGLAVEVYREILDVGFFDYHLHRICGRCDARNTASIRALEKIGLQREAHFIENEFVKGEWTDEVVLTIRRNQWSQRSVTPE